ncbi:polysaccharide biosynthesis tyrosine autokinase [Nostoc sp. UHCC 0302]|uniref:GumC family protein n=1 Tax=Nostoc sp. UHCC 0302 TaxID=3134896 RepID=UPI00311CB143
METQETSLSLAKYFQILQHRWIPALNAFLAVFIISVIALSVLKKPVYLAEGKLRLQRTNSTSSLTGLGTQIGTLDSVGRDAQDNPLKTESEVITSLPIIKKTIIEINMQNDRGEPIKIKEFIKKLTVKEVKGADVIQISYQDINPEIAAKVVNNLMDNYLEENIFSLRSEVVSARKFIEKQVPSAELVVRQAEAELAKFKEDYNVVSLQEEATRAVGILAELQQEINSVQSQFANTEAQSREIRQQLDMNPQEALVMASVSQNTGVQDMFKEVQLLESQLANRRTVLQDTHPEIIDLKDKLKSLYELRQQRIQQVGGTSQPQINKNFQLGALQQELSGKLVELESTRLGLAKQAATLSSLQSTYKQRLHNLPRLEQQHRQLERKVQGAQSTYLLLLQKLQESRIAENQKIGNASIISKADVPDEPSSSSTTAYLSAGLLAILAALTTIYVLEIKDKSIKTIDEAKKLLGLTVLGMIPSWQKAKKSFLSPSQKEPEAYDQRLVVRDAPRSAISEAYRMLRANLRFMSADKELKVTVITSSVPSEGKSTVAANLAVAVAQMEKKVLLIDGDLHRPVQHKIWNLTNNQGLSNLLVGQSEFSIAIKKVMDNLDVLTSGIVPPSPASLLDSKRMAKLIDNLAPNYDLVIIDTPSLNTAADAATLGQMADGVFLVVRPGVVNSGDATFAKEVLEKSGQNILGQIVNGVIPQNETHKYYYCAEEEHPKAGLVAESYFS